MTVSSMTPTTKRMEVLDFVDYMQIGNAVAVPKGNPRGDQRSARISAVRRSALLTGSYQLTVERARLRRGLHRSRQGTDPAQRVPGHAAGHLRPYQRTVGRRAGGLAHPELRRHPEPPDRDRRGVRRHACRVGVPKDSAW